MTTPPLPVENLSDLLHYLAPPMALLSAIDKWMQQSPDRVPENVITYRELWRRINAGEPVEEVDKCESAKI